jgi:hypothetical protein
MATESKSFSYVQKTHRRWDTPADGLSQLRLLNTPALTTCLMDVGKVPRKAYGGGVRSILSEGAPGQSQC